MRVLIAPDSFKESLSAIDAARAMARGLRSVRADVVVDLCPIADGGEGTVRAVVDAMAGRMISSRVCGPLGEPVDAAWGLVDEGRTAVIEMAEAAGLHLVPQERREPTRTTTFGVGQLIRAAMDAGCERILLGIGGSATTDGGAGMAQALGVQFINRNGETMTDPLAGGDLLNIARVDRCARDPRLAGVELTVACDVRNPLVGADGAAAVYGPQKGANGHQVNQLDAALTHLAALMEANPDRPGFGAAGGLGFGLVVFTNGHLRPGLDLVLEVVGLDQRLSAADWLLTGEGKLDESSRHGKAAWGVAERANAAGVPAVAMVGCNELEETGPFQAVHALLDIEPDRARAHRDAAELVTKLTAAWFRRIA